MRVSSEVSNRNHVPKATLVNAAGQKVVVDASPGNPEAIQYFNQGFQLMGPDGRPVGSSPALTPAPAPNAAPVPNPVAPGPIPAPQAIPGALPQAPSAPIGMDIFGKAMGEIQTKLADTAPIQAQKSALLKQLYDSPLSEQEMSALTPSQRDAIHSGNRNLIDLEVRMLNDNIKGRSNTLDQSMKYFTDTYQQNIQNIQDEKKTHFDNVMRMYDVGGSAAFKSMPEEQKRAFEKSNDLPIGFLDNPSQKEIDNVVTLKDAAGNEYLVDKVSGKLITSSAGRNIPNNIGSNAIVESPDGQFFDLSTYAADPGYGTSINSILKQMGQLTDENLQEYISGKSPNSRITAEDIKMASAATGVPWEPLVAILQKEGSFGTSNVSINNNNPGGITWSESYASSHPGVTKGTARPPAEGGNYVKFPTMGDGVKAVAEQLSNRAISADEAQSKKMEGLSDVDAIVQGIIDGSIPPSTTGLYGKSAAVKAGLAKRGFDLNKAGLQYEANKKFINSANSATQLKMRQAEASVEKSLESLRQLSNEFDRTGFRFANKAELQAAANGTMGPEKAKQAQALEGQISLISDELGSTFMGGNSPTDAAFKLVKGVLSSDFSKEVMDNQIDLLEKNLQYRKNAWASLGAVGGTPTEAPSTNQSYSGNTTNSETFDASSARSKYGY